MEIVGPDERMLGIGLGIPDCQDGIVTLVATEWSGFAESRELRFSMAGHRRLGVEYRLEQLSLPRTEVME